MGYVPLSDNEPYGRYEVVMANEAEAAIREYRNELAEAVRLCAEARKAISQGRIAVEEEQDMAAWSTQTAQLQAYLEQMVARQGEKHG
jgi:hypothetical protein